MICGVHALIGATLGKALKSKTRAFLGGIITHFFLDLTPHRDFSVPTEAALALTALVLIGSSQGWNSPAFWGALGGVAPDIENAISQTRGGGRTLFPSHNELLHGPKEREFLSQVGLALVCLAVLLAEGSNTEKAQK